MFSKLLRDERAQAMSEYGLLLALIAVFLVSTIVLFRDQLQTAFTAATNALKTN